MFRRRDKTIQVELVNPSALVSAARSPSLADLESSKASSGLWVSLDQFLKLAAIMVAVTNTVLVVMGYMRYVGMLQQFGISRTEVNFQFSDLLSFGYVSFLNMTLSGQVAVLIVTSVIALPVMLVVVHLKRDLNSIWQVPIIWVISMVLFFLVTAPYWLAFNPGKQAALKLAANSLGVAEDELVGLDNEQEVSTENGFLVGRIVLATPDITFLLTDSVLYKIRASDGKTLRKTHLQPKLKHKSQSL